MSGNLINKFGVVVNKKIEKLKEDYRKEFCNYEITNDTEVWYATPEKILEWLANRLEAIVRQGAPQPVFACGHCEHCKLDDDKTSASQGKHYCERHGDNIFEMFTETAFGENLTLETVGCRQFKQANLPNY